MSKASKRELWMAKFQELVREMNEPLARKIEWDTAEHFFNVGKTPSDSAVRYVETRMRAP